MAEHGTPRDGDYLTAARAWLAEHIEGYGYPSTAHKVAALAALLVRVRTAEHEAIVAWLQIKLDSESLTMTEARIYREIKECIDRSEHAQPARREGGDAG